MEQKNKMEEEQIKEEDEEETEVLIRCTVVTLEAEAQIEGVELLQATKD